MKTNRGQSLLEAILALAIFALIASALASMTIGGYQGLGYGGDYLEASALADEAIEAARSVRDGAWNEFIVSPAVATSTTGQWTLNNGASEIIGKFTRTLTFANVCRDGSQNVAPCPSSSTDLHSKLASTTVTWQSASGVTQEVKREAYLTNWDSLEWSHTDWTGLTGTNVDVSVAGQLTLAGGAAAWATTTNTGSQTWNDVYMFSATDGFVVGSGGSIRRWNNPNPNVWNVISSGTAQNLNTIHCSSATHCFAAGASGVIVRTTNGTSWSLFQDTGSQTWNDIRVFSLGDAVVVGSGGQVRRFAGGNWNTSMTSGTTQALNTVFCFAAANCWAAGGSGVITRWSSGSSWTLFQDTGSQTWNDIFMLSDTDGVVVGNGGLARRLVSGNWNTAVTTGTASNINGLYLTSGTTGWAVANTQSGEVILSWNGTSLPRLSISSLPDVALNGLYCVGSNPCFAPGASGNIFRYAGGGFQTSGSLISPAFDMSDNSPVQVLDWDETGCGSCDIQVRVGTSANSGGPWIWSGWFTDPVVAMLPTLLNGRRWVQYETSLTGPGNTTPVLQEVRINYK